MANSFKNYIATSVGISSNAVYSPITSGMQSTIIGMTLANITNVPIYASVKLNSGSANAYLIKDALIPTGGTLVPIGGDQKLVMEQSDILYVSSNANNSVDVIISVLEIS
jgi:hypothetical protein